MSDRTGQCGKRGSGAARALSACAVVVMMGGGGLRAAAGHRPG